MLERWENIKRQKGNIAGAEMARVLREQFGDEPLPIRRDLPPETQTRIRRFDLKTREALEEQGYRIYTLVGETLRSSLIHADKKLSILSGDDLFEKHIVFDNAGFRSDVDYSDRWFLFNDKPVEFFPELNNWLEVQAISRDVAVNPEHCFLPNSEGKTIREKDELIDSFFESLKEEIPDARARRAIKIERGKASDFAEILSLNRNAFPRDLVMRTDIGLLLHSEDRRIVGLYIADFSQLSNDKIGLTFKKYDDKSTGKVAPIIVPYSS